MQKNKKEVKDNKKKKKELETEDQELKVEEVSSKAEDKKAKKDAKKKKKKEKKAHYYGPIEFSFNFISLVFAICVGLYFGGRSFYYYSLQNQNKKETAMTLNGLLLDNNKLVKDEEVGLHKSDDGYYFKGNVTNNYVWFANRMFRVLSLTDDNNVKLVSDDLVTSFMWGYSSDYQVSNVRNWLTDNGTEATSGVYYKTIPAANRFLAKTKYTIDQFYENKIIRGDVEFDDYVVTLTLNDYIESGGKNSFLNNGKLFFILGYNESGENLYIEEDGSIMNCDIFDGYGVRSVITFSKNIPVSQGDGTKDNPYVIDQGDDTNYVDSYVKLGNDIWKVYDDTDGKLKMYLNGYITVDGNEVVRNYSSYSNKFNYFDTDNIGYYLSNDYFNSLSYNKYLIENTYPIGEMSDQTGYYFSHVFDDYYTGKIALLNIFDYVSSNEINNFFRDNTGSSRSTTQYAILENGILEEADVSDIKHIVPVVSIESSSIKNGNGRIDNPYVVE